MFQSLAKMRTGCHRSFPRHLLHRLTTLATYAIAAIIPQLIHAQTVKAESSSRPNIVLIMADDMGYECVAANGGTSYRTPRIDRLARQGMRFTHCHSQPICTPTRVQIMTGRYNHRNYLRFGLLDPKATTFAHVLKRAGYKTCIAGKWQLSGGLEAPRRFGFDEYCLWQVNRRPGRYPNPGLEINGQQKDYNNGEYGPDLVSDYLCGFMERNRDRPFFAYYPMILPHWPFEPTPDGDDWDPKARGVLKGHGKNRYFADMVKYTDKMVGKIVDKLEELGIRDNTLLVFTGDNGTYQGITSRMGKVSVRGGKGTMLDAGTHVPFVASWPGKIPAGTVNSSLVDFTDILPTLADVGRAKLSRDIPTDGHSIYPLLLDAGAEPARRWIFCWYERNGKRATARQMARTAHYKLYENGKFFDTANDPLEQQPLQNLTDKQSAIRAQLQAVIDQANTQWKRPPADGKKKKKKRKKNGDKQKKLR